MKTTYHSKKNSYGTFKNINDSDINFAFGEVVIYFTNLRKYQKFIELLEQPLNYWHIMDVYNRIEKKQHRVVLKGVQYNKLGEVNKALFGYGVSI